ncbi:efflux RND transporter periplasmic adaptor subunit [Zhongshania aliphaticivorans]|uniref:efflux RND transporter periplasmic adaptor subunit n=1 Tax=Zhongshania aliphaticivorans TaxID=1470434 RepID=UPI0012E44B7B|nr:HlyD family efflux transporter periplasmic adaptor subunit [Zhongshania aliphaticivorans]CAA0078433.1 Cobalt-zinc-cadmium resistance protein CzcB [Zhongshania aliphaticivorans]
MSNSVKRSLIVSMLVALLMSLSSAALAVGAEVQEIEPEKGPHRGRMLREDDFAIELAIFETGVPPEFRVWASQGGEALPPENVKVSVTLGRLGDGDDQINFKPQEDFLRGDMEIVEPHSFLVTLNASYGGKHYQWQYDNFEGRTRINADVAEAMGISTDAAGSQLLVERLPLFGRLVADTNALTQLSARFDGVIKAIHVSLGQQVKAGTPLMSIESNESLKSYVLRADIAGEIAALPVNIGEATAGRTLVSIVDRSRQVVLLKAYPDDLRRIALNNSVQLLNDAMEEIGEGVVQWISPLLNADQSADIRVSVDTSNLALPVGSFVRGNVEVARYEVPLAVKRQALQGFRDFTVVYAKVGDQYEVRMLELGREAGDWIEVLGGLKLGTEYVTENSYIIKADIEKSGASHDH